ncbi:hypothetical protein RJT34_17143 [Clitoria ternatea]|uniref:Uncharacterized protein n=1 Tax=Clitoria ternatea TaxID=43366 RepID=A0AAN9JA09_CLITE
MVHGRVQWKVLVSVVLRRGSRPSRGSISHVGGWDRGGRGRSEFWKVRSGLGVSVGLRGADAYRRKPTNGDDLSYFVAIQVLKFITSLADAICFLILMPFGPF